MHFFSFASIIFIVVLLFLLFSHITISLFIHRSFRFFHLFIFSLCPCLCNLPGLFLSILISLSLMLSFIFLRLSFFLSFYLSSFFCLSTSLSMCPSFFFCSFFSHFSPYLFFTFHLLTLHFSLLFPFISLSCCTSSFQFNSSTRQARSANSGHVCKFRLLQQGVRFAGWNEFISRQAIHH